MIDAIVGAYEPSMEQDARDCRNSMCGVLRVKKKGPHDDGSGLSLRVRGGQLISMYAVILVRVFVFLAGCLFSFLVDCLL